MALCLSFSHSLASDGRDANIYDDRVMWDEATQAFSNNRAFEYVERDETLPDVLVIGTSISIGYTSPLREALRGVANLYRIPVNGGDTRLGLRSIDYWLSDKRWSVVHVNWGLHDLKYNAQVEQNIPLATYRSNVEKLLRRISQSCDQIIWAHTSYVPDGVAPRRDEGDDALYNEAVESLIKNELRDLHIIIDDQYTLTKDHPELQQPHNVHFTVAGYALQAEQAGEAIKKWLREAE